MPVGGKESAASSRTLPSPNATRPTTVCAADGVTHHRMTAIHSSRPRSLATRDWSVCKMNSKLLTLVIVIPPNAADSRPRRSTFLVF